MASGSFGLGTSNGYVVGCCYWESTPDTNSNTSNVHMHLHFSRTNSASPTWGSGTFWLNCDGQYAENSLSFEISQDSNILMVECSFTVGHNADGTRSIHMEAGGGTDVFDVYTGAVDVGLDTIPRVGDMSLSVVGTDLGTQITIYANSPSSDFRYTYRYKIGSVANDINALTTSQSVTWTPPLDLANQIPNNPSGEIMMYVDYWSGSNFIGTSSDKLYINVPDNVNTKPYNIVTTLTDPTNYKNTYANYVQTKSKVRAVTTASFRYGASIASCTVTFSGVTMSGTDVTSPVCPTAGTIAVTTTIKDTRGFSQSVTQNITVLAYTPPSITTLTVSRCTEAGVADDTGAWAKVTVAATITSLNNINTKSFVISAKEMPSGTYITKQTITNVYTINTYYVIAFSGELAYDVKLAVTDAFGTVEKSIPLSTAYTLMSHRYGGKGIAFGEVATEDKFSVNLDANFKKALMINGVSLVDLFWRVGDIKETTTNVNPGTYLLGTTWVAWGVGRTSVGVDTTQTEFNTVEKTGGEKAHVLTTTEMPNHTHIANGAATAIASSNNNLFMGSGNPPVGTVGNVGYTGSNGAHNNLQPYITCYKWKRTA